MRLQSHTPQAEFRNYPRYRYTAPVEILFRVPGTEEFSEGITCAVCHDVSRSGIRIYSSIPLEGKDICVRFHAPNHSKVMRVVSIIRCAVLGNQTMEYGLVFESLLPELMIGDIAKESGRPAVDPESFLS